MRNFILLRAFTVYMENAIWLKWNLHWSEFHYTRSHVNADNEIASHRSEILPRSETSNRFEFSLGLI